MDYENQLNLAREALAKSASAEYEGNMKRVGVIIVGAHADKVAGFDDLLRDALSVLSQNTGSHTDLDVLESILDQLYDLGIIDGDKYEQTVRNSACGRWL